ncbi:hypothetical protein FRB94_007230 [Tulasnella sp. JGI-2019a]|nr:hypothetical protein FRB94_007230 [Tulasnella sp. JGI-2019a]
MPALEREVVDVTAVIRNILDNYPAGSAVLREFLQNSDDCGAQSQDFILDTRTFPTEALVDPALACCQGPALLTINNGHFREKDWNALEHIHNSSKTADETTTGKYGLGFRSCYHVTDNPHILSGNKLLVLDPHNRVEQYPGGFSLKLDNDNDQLYYHDHFRAFQSVLSEDMQIYDGTAIRLPLRLQDQAKQSGIKSVATSVNDMRVVFKDFVHKELREVMLFLKNITSIGLYEVGSNGVKKQIARAWIEDPSIVAPLRSRNRGREQESSTYELRIRVEDGESSINKATTGLRTSGKLFTLLPLPIVTGFPLHIHAIFALTSSRQSLRNQHDVTSGSREEFLVQWNLAVFRDFVPEAWTVLLRYATSRAEIDSYDLWPKIEAADQAYWRGLLDEILKRTAPERIWPVLGQGDSAAGYHPLSGVLAPTNAGAKLLGILADCGVLISRPPEHVYNLVLSSQAHRLRIMAPSTVVNAIKSDPTRLSYISASSRAIVSDYISTGNDIRLFRDIPVIPRVDGTWTSISSNSSYILVTKPEADLFDGVDPQANLLSLDLLGERTKALLLSSNHIDTIQPTHVVYFVARKSFAFRSAIPTISAGVRAEDVAWLTTSWNWIGGWKEAQNIWRNTTLRSRFCDLHIIPLATDQGRREIRLFSKMGIDPTGVDEELLQVFRELQLPVLHSDVTVISSVLQMGLKSASDIKFLLSELQAQQSISLSQPERRCIHGHFANHLPALRQQLQYSELKALRRLPIYPVLRPGLRKTQGFIFEPGPNSPLLADDSVEVVPIIHGNSMIAASECRSIIAAAYSPGLSRENDVLELAIQMWQHQQQDQELSSLLVGRIISRLGDLSSHALALVAKLPIVDVGLGPSKLRSPADTVDPSPNIAQLFDAGEGVLPQGLFAAGDARSYLRQLRNYGMLLDKFTTSVAIDRIGYLVNSAT